MKDVDINRKTAAIMIIRFLAKSKLGADFKSLTSISDTILKFEDKLYLTNFLDGRSTGEKGDVKVRIQLIVDTAKQLFEDLRENKGRFSADEYSDFEIPSSMVALFEDAFGERSDHQEINLGQVDSREALGQLADVLSKAKIGDFRSTIRLKNAFADRIYDVYRWTSPSQKKENPRAVRASLTFSHPAKRTGFLRFIIHYKPYELDEEGITKNHSTTEGIVVPIGEHIFLFGSESSTEYPLIICASVDNDNPQDFRGLVLRRADKKNDLFAARVTFREHKNIKFIADLDSRIGIIPEDKLTTDEVGLLKKVSNLVANDGKQALSYLPLEEEVSSKKIETG